MRYIARSDAGLLARIAPLAIIAAVALGTAACGKEEAEAKPAESAVMIGGENVAIAQTQEIETGPTLSGTLKAEQEATVRAEVSGSILQVYAEKGQAVPRGAPLARIEQSAAQEAYRSGQSGVRAAQNAHEVAQREVARIQALVTAGAVAERDLELARRNLSTAQAQLADARARQQAARTQLANSTVRAPISGVVSERPANAGDVVGPGAALFTIINPSRMRLEASVPATELGNLRLGAPVRFTVTGYPGKTFQGSISRVNPSADPVTRQVPIYVAIPNSDGSLVAGLFAEGRVASQSRTALVIPLGAVDQTGVAPTVLRVKGGVTERVQVQLGITDAETERVEVTGGVAAGDTLLVGAGRGTTPGKRVQITAASR